MKDSTLQSRLIEKEIKLIRAKLEKAEAGGFTNETKDQILKQAKYLFNAKYK